MENFPEGLVAGPGGESSSVGHSVQSSHYETSLDIRSLAHSLENNTSASNMWLYFEIVQGEGTKSKHKNF